MTTAIGVDGCRDGWIAVAFDVTAGPGSARASFYGDFADLVAAHGNASVVVDMPIGFVAGAEGRGCDHAARAILGPRKSSVFTPPCRRALYAPDYAAANALNREVTGKGLSKQAWMIAPKMREIDAIMTPALQDGIAEGHPEVAFAVAQGSPMSAHKARFHGIFERLRVLQGLGFDPARVAETVPGDIRAAPDDLLDACILAHVAQKRGAGSAVVFPDVPRMDEMGLRMEIWA